ncbi:MAG TPA: GNAT family N-acetyltransferase [Rhizomicrobium sp.]|jgi:phosphinothricin acetyltransferase|nr:GNAT family N-acetyltransferase [Rhizomicrobium sp.]
MSGVLIRRIEEGDLPALLDIYNHYVIHTAISFDVEPRTLADRQDWFATFRSEGRYQCFVAVEDGRAIGWASSGKYKERAAYQTSAELSVYLAPDKHRRGLGRQLYATLISALKGADIHRLYGGITLPNASSVALHESFGFKRVSLTSEVGRKFGKYWDVALYEREME